MGLLDLENQIQIKDWLDLPREALRLQLGTSVPKDAASFLSAVTSLVPEADAPELLDALSWLGLLPTTTNPLPFAAPSRSTAPIDLLATVLAHQLRYHPGERDLVLLHHEIVARPETIPGYMPVQEEEVYTSSLVAYGDERASAMARTVGMPLAFAARAVLDGSVRARGVCGPGVEKEVWGRVLSGLEEAGLGMREEVVKRKVFGGGGCVETALADV